MLQECLLNISKMIQKKEIRVTKNNGTNKELVTSAGK
jgi:hypothetical protein